MLDEVAGISSSVSSSVVLLAFNKMFKRRFRGNLLLPLAVVEVAVVVFDDEDVSDLRFFNAKNRRFLLANYYATPTENNYKKNNNLLLVDVTV